MAGRPRKPTALKVLEGNRGRRPIPKEIETTGTELSRLPSWFPKGAHRFFEDYGPELKRAADLRKIEDGSLSALCFAWGMFELKAQEHLRGPKKDRAGAGREMHKALDAFTRLASRFGLTPADRSRVFAKPEDSEHETGLLNGQGRSPSRLKLNAGFNATTDDLQVQ